MRIRERGVSYHDNNITDIYQGRSRKVMCHCATLPYY
jgi:hypothetical protein